MEPDSAEHKQICKECPHNKMERCKCDGSCLKNGIS